MADIKFVADVDAAKAMAGLRELEKQVGDVGKAAEGTHSQLGDFGRLLDKYGIDTAGEAARKASALKADLQGLEEALKSGEISLGGYETATAKISQELTKLEGKPKAVGQEVQTKTGILDKASIAWGKAAAVVGTAMLAYKAVEKGLRLVTAELKASFEAAVEAERVDNALRATLELTGREVENNVARFEAYATAIQRKTKHDGDATKSTITLLAQLTALNEDGLEEATRGAIGLASVLDVDLKSAARTVAQAYEGNYSALSKLIPQVRNATTEDEKHAAMVDALGKMYRRAEADVQGIGGTLTQLQNIKADVRKEVGELITKNEEFGAALQFVKKFGDELVETLKSMNESTSVFGIAISASVELLRRKFGPAMAWIMADMAEANARTREQKRAMDAWGSSILILAEHLGIYKKEQKDTTAAVLDLGKVAKDAGVTLKSDLQKELANTERAMRLLKGKIPDAEFAKLEQKARDLKEALSDAASRGWAPFMTAAETAEVVLKRLFIDVQLVATEAPKAALDAKKVLENVVTSMLHFERNYTDESKRLAAEAFAAWREGFLKKLSEAQMVIGMLNSIFSQASQNRLIELDNEYKARLKYINLTIKDEKKRQEAVQALEAEYQIKRQAASSEAARKSKAISLMEAVVNTAAAVTGALGNKPWTPFNFALASIVAALGAVQIGMIAAQPVPLARGGIVTRRTLAELGEEDRKEAVIPLERPEGRRALREALGGSQGLGASGRPISLRLQVYVAGKRVVDSLIPDFERASRKGWVRLEES